MLFRSPRETLECLKAAGFFKALGPRRFGGHEDDLESFFDAVIELAKACPSTAWVTSLFGIHTWMVGLFPEAAQTDVWPDAESGDEVIIASAIAPRGRATEVDGGYRLSGRWRCSSGCDDAGWTIMGAALDTGDGAPHRKLELLVPAADYRIEDTWFVAGLRGTGSNDLVVDEAFVPAHRALSLARLFAGSPQSQRVHDAPLFLLPWMPVFVFGLAAPAIGTALGALENYIEHVGTRRAAYTGALVAENASSQVRVAEASSCIDAARLIMRRDLGEMRSYAESGKRCPFANAVRYRWDAPYVAKLCRQAVDMLFGAAGAAALLNTSPLQRAFRDIHAMSAHAILNSDIAGQIYGRELLGLRGDPSLF